MVVSSTPSAPPPRHGMARRGIPEHGRTACSTTSDDSGSFRTPCHLPPSLAVFGPRRALCCSGRHTDVADLGPKCSVVVVVQMIKNTPCLSRVVPKMQLIMEAAAPVRKVLKTHSISSSPP